MRSDGVPRNPLDIRRGAMYCDVSTLSSEAPFLMPSPHEGASLVRTPRGITRGLRYAGATVGAILLGAAVAALVFSDPLADRLLRARLHRELSLAFPGSTVSLGAIGYSIWTNRLDVDSLRLTTADSGFSYSLGNVSLDGISWWRLYRDGALTRRVTAEAGLDVRSIVVVMRPSCYEFRAASLLYSAADSTLVLDSCTISSQLTDKEFFERSRFRQTRFLAAVPRMRMTGMDLPASFASRLHRMSGIVLENVTADILVNMDKPYDKNSTPPQMPHEILAALRDTLRVDSILVRNGSLRYSERVAVQAKPGVISFDSVSVAVRNLANHGSPLDTTRIEGDGRFMQGGIMRVAMALPLNDTTFSMRYAGSLESTDARVLNAFLEPCEFSSITAGHIQSATYQVTVASGHASGSLSARYRDLRISLLDKTTGSSQGLLNQIKSLYGRLFIIRGTNPGDTRGALKIGRIRYTRKADDYFLQFLWFALRGSVADVVGFKVK